MPDRSNPIHRLATVFEHLRDAERILSSDTVRGNNGKDVSASDREALLHAVMDARDVAASTMQNYYRKFAPGRGVQVCRREKPSKESNT